MLAHRHAGQIQEDGGDLTPHRDTLHRLARIFPDTWLRHRANVMLLVANGVSRTEAARRVGCTSNSLRNWAHHLPTDERGGLADRPCNGRPPKLDQAAPALLDTVLTTPLDNGFPVTIRAIAEFTDLVNRRSWAVRRAAVSRSLLPLGYRYRRPRHDLTHRQDPEAGAAAKHVFVELQTTGLLELDSGSSTWMNVKSTFTPPWQKAGTASGSR